MVMLYVFKDIEVLVYPIRVGYRIAYFSLERMCFYCLSLRVLNVALFVMSIAL